MIKSRSSLERLRAFSEIWNDSFWEGHAGAHTSAKGMRQGSRPASGDIQLYYRDAHGCGWQGVLHAAFCVRVGVSVAGRWVTRLCEVCCSSAVEFGNIEDFTRQSAQHAAYFFGKRSWNLCRRAHFTHLLWDTYGVFWGEMFFKSLASFRPVTKCDSLTNTSTNLLVTKISDTASYMLQPQHDDLEIFTFTVNANQVCASAFYFWGTYKNSCF